MVLGSGFLDDGVMENNTPNMPTAGRAASDAHGRSLRVLAAGFGLVALVSLSACDLDIHVDEDTDGNTTVSVDDATTGEGPELTVSESDDELIIKGDWVDEYVTVEDGAINVDTSDLEDAEIDDINVAVNLDD